MLLSFEKCVQGVFVDASVIVGINEWMHSSVCMFDWTCFLPLVVLVTESGGRLYPAQSVGGMGPAMVLAFGAIAGRI